jgi:hypothetical protein
MYKSPDIDQLMIDIGKMQKEYGTIIPKDTQGNRSGYASLCQILGVIQDRCLKYNIVLTQDEVIHDGVAALATTLFHTPSKQWKQGLSILTPNPSNANTDWAWGGSTTYHRRYGAMMALGLFQDEDPTDNDGAVSETQQPQPRSFAPSTQTEPRKYAPGYTKISTGQVGLLKGCIARSKKPNAEAYVLSSYNIKAIEDVPKDECNYLKDWLEGKI